MAESSDCLSPHRETVCWPTRRLTTAREESELATGDVERAGGAVERASESQGHVRGFGHPTRGRSADLGCTASRCSWLVAVPAECDRHER